MGSPTADGDGISIAAPVDHQSDAADRRQTPVSRRRFIDLLYQRLRYRWLSDPVIVRRAIADLFGRAHAKRDRLVSDLVGAHRVGGQITPASIRPFLSRHPAIRGLFRDRETISVPSHVFENQGTVGPGNWPLPPIKNVTQLADWLSLTSPAVLDWLILPHRRRSTAVDHYQRRSAHKRDGTYRWIEEPKPVLKRVQRWIKSELVDQIPMHDAAHGFRRSRGVVTAARPHVGKQVVLCLDLKDFFGSVSTGRVRNLLLMAGYPGSVATPIAQLCTAAPLSNVPISSVLNRSRLPQGAPTSPGLANATAFRLDRRLFGLSQATGVAYTRYADDLVFSGGGDFAGRSRRFATSAAAIVMDEGFAVNFRKTRTMRRGGRQQILGLVVNEQLNTPRREYETLKAILTNCVRLGPESQNRESHPCFRESLRGRIAQIASVNPDRGVKLLARFQSIRWP